MNQFYGFKMHTKCSDTTSCAFNTIEFRKALSQFATGVTIITTRLNDGTLLGLTVSSFNAVSLNPPLILWSLSKYANSLSAFKKNSHYIVNVLAAEQAELAHQFTRKSINRFQGIKYKLSRAKQPILKHVVAWFECHHRSCYPEGDHIIFVGEVERCKSSPQAALIFHNSAFTQIKIKTRI